MNKLKRPTLGRILVALTCSIFFLRLPDLMPITWKALVVVMILLFFLVIPDLRGLKGGLVACFFSLSFAGFGQFYAREYLRGFLFSFGAVFSYMMRNYSAKSEIFNIVLFIIAAIDAFSYGKRGIGIF